MRTINTSLLMSLTQPGFNSFTDCYPMVPKEFTSVFEHIPTERAYEVTAELQMMGSAMLTREGESSASDIIQQKGQKVFTVSKYTLMIAPTQEILADNLYKEMSVPKYGTAFMQSHIQRQNIEAFDILNNAWSTTNVGWDNLPYLSEEHTYVDGVQSNTLPINAPLHELSVNQLFSRMTYMKAPNGFFINGNFAKKLIVSPPMAMQAYVLLKSPTRTGTASLELNPINGMEIFRGNDFEINHYITPNAYFFRTSQEGAKWYERQSLKTLQAPDPQNWSLIISSSMRYTFNFDNWRSLFGARAPMVQGIE